MYVCLCMYAYACMNLDVNVLRYKSVHAYGMHMFDMGVHMYTSALA